MTHPADILQEAAKVIERGWCQGAYTDGYGSYCMLGATGVAAGGVTKADDQTLDYIDYVLPTALLANWNDAAGRTQAEVADALRCAASLALDGEDVDGAA